MKELIEELEPIRECTPSTKAVMVEEHATGNITVTKHHLAFDTAIAALKVAVAENAKLQAQLEDAYKQGWLEAANWSNRQDMVCDTDSPAYVKARDVRLNAIRAKYAVKKEPKDG